MRTFSLVLGDGTRTAIAEELTLGRGPANQLRLVDPAVSRRHARLIATPDHVEIHDLGSRSGTFLDGQRVHGCARAADGQRLRIGDTRMRIERDRHEDEALPTVIVPPGRTLQVDMRGRAATSVESIDPLPQRPRLRSGWARKRLAAGEGEWRVVLENLRTGRFLRLTTEEARLLDRLDGTRTLGELVRGVSAEAGESGVRRLLEVLTELADLGMLAGAEAPETPPRGWRRLLKPRELVFPGAPAVVAWLYRAGGRWLFSRPGRALIAATVVVGGAAFALVMARGGVRPFHVAGMVTVGGLAFIGGRLGVVALHELGHALTLTSLGRRPRRIGMKLLFVLPYAFVDTSEAWYEPRRRRIAVSAAGPVTDALLAGVFALAALATAGVARDVAFQLALGAYLGALLNLNPLLERDGYQMLADLVREPNLRRRGREHVAARLAGKPVAQDERRAVRLYGVLVLAWGLVIAAVAGVIALHVVGRETGDTPLALGVAVLVLALALVPSALHVARPVAARRKRALAARESRSSLGGALAADVVDAVAVPGTPDPTGYPRRVPPGPS